MFLPLLPLGNNQAVEAVDIDVGENLVDVRKLLEGDPGADFSLFESFADEFVGADVDGVDANNIIGEDIPVLLPEVSRFLDEITSSHQGLEVSEEGNLEEGSWRRSFSSLGDVEDVEDTED